MAIAPLPPSVACRIHAEQVVTDVKDVVKELLENALDAGAKHIKIKLENHGLDLIELEDDGSGIPPDSRACFAAKSHTSKISAIEDLLNLHSFGFRGEALNAICTLSPDVTVFTRCESEKCAVKMRLTPEKGVPQSEPSEELKHTGTRVVVRGIFSRTPVRRQHLEQKKREQIAEALDLVYQYSVALPELDIEVFISGSNSKFIRRPKKSIRDALFEVIGPDVKYLEEGEKVEEDTKIRYLLPPPDPSFGNLIRNRSSSSRMFFIVNKRPIDLRRMRDLSTIVLTRWRNAFNPPMKSKLPVFVLELEMPPSAYEVNVDPDKRRLNFAPPYDTRVKNLLIQIFDQHYPPAITTTSLPAPVPSPSLATETSSPICPATPPDAAMDATQCYPPQGFDPTEDPPPTQPYVDTVNTSRNAPIPVAPIFLPARKPTASYGAKAFGGAAAPSPPPVSTKRKRDSEQVIRIDPTEVMDNTSANALAEESVDIDIEFAAVAEEFQKVQEIEAEERLEEAEPANVTPANIRQAELVGYIGGSGYVIRIGTALFAFHVSRADELVLFNSLRDSHVLRPDPVFPPLLLNANNMGGAAYARLRTLLQNRPNPDPFHANGFEFKITGAFEKIELVGMPKTPPLTLADLSQLLLAIPSGNKPRPSQSEPSPSSMPRPPKVLKWIQAEATRIATARIPTESEAQEVLARLQDIAAKLSDFKCLHSKPLFAPIGSVQ